MDNVYKAELSQQTIQELVQRIRKAVVANQIIIFGSSARELMAYDSDIDVLVVVPDGTHRRRASQQIYMSLVGFGKPVDVVVATTSDINLHKDKPGYIYRNALTEGKTIYAA